MPSATAECESDTQSNGPWKCIVRPYRKLVDSVKTASSTDLRSSRQSVRAYSPNSSIISAGSSDTSPRQRSATVTAKQQPDIVRESRGMRRLLSKKSSAGQQSQSDRIAEARHLLAEGQQSLHLSQDASDLDFECVGDVSSPAASPNGDFRTADSSIEEESDVFPDHIPTDAKDEVEMPGCYFVTLNVAEGKDLIARDLNGLSDPYFKVKVNGKVVHKSATIMKNLNPEWNENVSFFVEYLSKPIVIEVWDFDFAMSDDSMGYTEIYLKDFEPKKLHDVKQKLTSDESQDYMGHLRMSVEYQSQSQEERKSFMKASRTKSGASLKATKGSKGDKNLWKYIANIVLVEASDLHLPPGTTRTCVPEACVQFRLGAEKYKSKVAALSNDPKWVEQFDMYIYDEKNQKLQLSVTDRRSNIQIGSCSIDLTNLTREVTHQKWYELEKDAGWILLLISLTATNVSETVSDIKAYEENPISRNVLNQRYSVWRTFNDIKDIGFLTVKVYQGQNLAVADLSGKSDPFCVLELVNARLRTQTEYKTLNPQWNKIFTFSVTDIHTVLEISVYDEDSDRQAELLGKVAIPLSSIRNNQKRWYALKDRKLCRRSKGQILLEMFLIYNPVRAAIRTINPRETKYLCIDQKFKRQIFMKNVMRVKTIALSALETGAFVQKCFTWESPLLSATAFAIFMLMAWFGDLWMLPLGLMFAFLGGFIKRTCKSAFEKPEEYYESDADEDTADAEKEDPKQKASLIDKVQAVQDTLGQIQVGLDNVACCLERMRNACNFTNKFLSCLAMLVLFIGALVLYFIPIRWLVMLWGINKFTKKLRAPNAINNNELMDYLSRVPSDTEIRQFGEIKPEVLAIPGERRGTKIPPQR